MNNKKSQLAKRFATIIFIIIVVSLLFNKDNNKLTVAYMGPILSLTLTEKSDFINVERNITYDFLAADKGNYVYEDSKKVHVVDSYTLTNESNKDKSIKFAYPFVGSLSIPDRPKITVDGAIVKTVLYAGAYSGGFYGSDGKEGSVNLRSSKSWEEYKALLEDGTYMAAAFSKQPELNQPAVIYDFSEIEVDQTSSENLYLVVEYNIDREKTKVLDYGFHISGNSFYAFGLPNKGAKYLIVVGDDLLSYTVKCYKDFLNTKNYEISIEDNTIRYETTLGEIFSLLVDDVCKKIDSNVDSNSTIRPAEDEISFEMYYDKAVEFFNSYGPLSDTMAERYSRSLYNLINESCYVYRVFYQTYETVIPAGKSITVSAELTKYGSHDFVRYGNKKTYLYDTLTTPGSNLILKDINVNIQNYGNIEMVRQNYSFDLKNGVTAVNLDPNIECLYMEIKPNTEK